MSVDRQKIIDDLSKLRFKGNDNGLIPGFGVLVQQMPAYVWNLFSVKIIEQAGEALHNEAAALLENAAHECGYHTGYGIITSEEFKSVCGPMIGKETGAEDTLHAAFAVFSAWGWADIEVVEIVPGEKMVLRSKNYYEQDMKYINPQIGRSAYMIKGVARAFMELAYGGAYPDGMKGFVCEQTKGIEAGDEIGEFIITKG